MDFGIETADYASDAFGQLRGAGERRFTALGDQHAGDLAAGFFFAVQPEHFGDILLGSLRQPLGGALAARSVHAHVERTILTETEPAFGHIQLRRGHAQIEQYAIQTALRLRPAGHFGERTVVQGNAGIGGEMFAGMRDGLRILVHQQQVTIRTKRIEQAAGMATTAESAIEVASIGF